MTNLQIANSAEQPSIPRREARGSKSRNQFTPQKLQAHLDTTSESPLPASGGARNHLKKRKICEGFKLIIRPLEATEV
jgi:hypothetical protein